MNEKNRKKKQAQDLAARRILVIVLVTALILWGMSSLYDMMTYGTTFMLGQRVNLTVMAVSGAAAVACLIWFLWQRKNGKLPKDRVIHSGFLTLCAAVICACCGILHMDYYNGMHILYIFLPLIAVLFLVYHIYERQFFTFCVVEAAAIATAYCFYAGMWEKNLALAVTLVLCVIPMLLSLMKPEKRDGLVVTVLGREFDRRYTLLSYGATIAALAAVALVQGKLAMVIGLLLGAYVLASAVYYTIKAM